MSLINFIIGNNVNDIKKNNRFLEALNGFINAFELEQGKIGTKIKDKNDTEYVYCGSEYHNLENVDMEAMTESQVRAMGDNSWFEKRIFYKDKKGGKMMIIEVTAFDEENSDPNKK